MSHPEIAAELISLKDRDFELRQRLVETGELFEGYNNEMEDLHKRNAASLNKILDEIGYPTIAKVGKEASDAAWLVLQHSISLPAFMVKGLELLKTAVNAGEADPKNLAYLSDRIATFKGLPQLYGTQFDWDKNGLLSPQPYDDLALVNQRRKSIGLNTLEEQTDILREQALAENHNPPADFDMRQSEIFNWKKQVGWITCLCLLLVGCAQKQEVPYFNFDRVSHYRIEVEEEEVFRKAEDPDLSEHDKLMHEITIGAIPQSFSDTSFVSKLGSLGFSETNLGADRHEVLREVFREKKHKRSYATTCAAVYRDVLIFREQGAISGMAKICFDCGKHRILGTDARTIDFGQSGDYARLETVLTD